MFRIEREGQRVLAWMTLCAALVLALWMFGHLPPVESNVGQSQKNAKTLTYST
jgi:hypothetical protein